MPLTEPILSQIPGNPLTGLRNADELWQATKSGPRPAPEVMTQQPDKLGLVQYDALICGGTLGILLGAALAAKGWQVALIERGELRGRDQEWNISLRELATFIRLGLLTQQQIEAAIASHYNPARIAFGSDRSALEGDSVLWVKDVLNIGVDPVTLLAQLKDKFLAEGGTLLEHTAFRSAAVHPNGVAVAVAGHSTGSSAGNSPGDSPGDSPANSLGSSEEQLLTARLLIDAMGHFSPLVQQARKGQKPDAVCLVVGTCAQGYPENETGDLIVSFTPIRNQCQYFWEAFPARDGRTTYLFTYLDAHPQRPALADLFEDYFHLLPDYQQVSLEQLTFIRALFGFFPCYRDSPLQYPWGRTLAVGDSSGQQSPLSFGGFGAMVRHLSRLTAGIDEALRADALDAKSLGMLQPYQPNLSVTWLFQKAMSVGVEQSLPPERINQVLSTIFADMADLGDEVLKPFLQDVVQFPALANTMALTTLRHPALVAKILPQVGVSAIALWLRHFLSLGGYSLLNAMQEQVENREEGARQRYRANRWRETLKYGSGGDYD